MKMKPEKIENLKEILDSLPEKYAALAAIGIATGARISEILQIKRMDLLDPSGKFRPLIKLLVLKKRGSRIVKRILTISKEFRPYIIRHLDSEFSRGHVAPDCFVFRGSRGRHLSRISAYCFFRKTLGEFHGTHWMRKTFANAMFDAIAGSCGQIRAVKLMQRALAHARIDSTFAYLDIDNKELANAQNSYTSKIFAT